MLINMRPKLILSKKLIRLGITISLLLIVVGLFLWFGLLPQTKQGTNSTLAPYSIPNQVTLQANLSYQTEQGLETITNGELVTLTLEIVNTSSTLTFADTEIFIGLPPNAFNGESIVTSGQKNTITETMPSLRGGEETILEVIQGVSLLIPQLDPNQSDTITLFQGRVKCQTDGNSLTMQARLSATDSTGTPHTPTSNLLEIPIRLKTDSIQTKFSSDPTWCSNDLPGNFDAKWADFDNDGYLDLALSSTRGLVIYHNQAGTLKNFFETEHHTLGLAWADVDNDKTPELIAVGESADDNNVIAPGTNYIYKYNPTSATFEEWHKFPSDFQLLRVAPGDYTGDGHVDLAVSSTALKVTDPVRLYINDGSGKFGEESIPLSSQATADIAPADFDNDGDLDLVVSRFFNKDIIVLNNQGGELSEGNITQVAYGVPFLAYNFAWGDYDHDGYLDLAAGLPMQREVHVYHNLGGEAFTLEDIISTRKALSPRAITWNDFSRDGKLDLVFIDQSLQIYEYVEGEFAQTNQIITPNSIDEADDGRLIWAIQGLDIDNDGDLEVNTSHENAPSTVHSAYAAPLTKQFTPLKESPAFPAASLSCGDFNGDKMPDLFFGAGDGSNTDNRLYINSQGKYSRFNNVPTGFGPNQVAIADVNGDENHFLDIAVSGRGRPDTILICDKDICTTAWTSKEVANTTSLAFGDSDENSEHRPDLLVGIANGPNMVYFSPDKGDPLALEVGWQTPEEDNTRSVAWGNINGYGTDLSPAAIQNQDSYLDFAVGNYAQPNRIYQNKGDGTFALVWSGPDSDNTTDIAWGDYDKDGDLDLAVANHAQPNCIYENQTQNETIIFNKVWCTTVASQTTSIAWGDWDNDDDLDLAMGNTGEADQIYTNKTSASGQPDFDLMWESPEQKATSDLIWCDHDRDGDLDLFISQNSKDDKNGYYVNITVTPSHIDSVYNPATTPLVNNPVYLKVNVPGQTKAGDLYYAAEVLSGPPAPNPIPIQVDVFDPDGALGVRRTGVSETVIFGEPIHHFNYEYSLNGDGHWQQATPFSSTTTITPTRQGTQHTFYWDAVKDQAISNNVRFRVCAVAQPQFGGVSRSLSCSTSPPFRVRGTTCTWPDLPHIIFDPPLPKNSQGHYVANLGQIVELQGNVEVGSGSLYFDWDACGAEYLNSQIINHTFQPQGLCPIVLTVYGEGCPVSGFTYTDTIVAVGNAYNVYLPLLLKQWDFASTTTQQPVNHYRTSNTAPNGPNAVQGLTGYIDLATQSTVLVWQPNPATGQVTHYNIYRRAQQGERNFILLNIVPAENTLYTDQTVMCGYSYFITAVNEAGESQPSTASYYNPQCKP